MGALKNVWRGHRDGIEADVVTYGTMPHPDDPGRNLMRINFFHDNMLQVGKTVITTALEEDRKSAKYIDHFCDVELEAPDPNDRSAMVRFQRRVLAYRALLADAGFAAGTIQASTRHGNTPLFNQQLIAALAGSNSDADGSHAAAAVVFGQPNPSWARLSQAFAALRDFIKRGSDTGYAAFNTAYANRPNGSGDKWDDPDFVKILGMWEYANGTRMLGRVRPQHTTTLTRDYTDQIYDDLVGGKMVIIDQSQGNDKMNKMVAYRTMDRILRGNQQAFSSAQRPAQIVVYIEEAHNLLPHGSDQDYSDVWVRTAKEGAKLHIGLVYATQEVSSIQRNILKNTANWFVGHLNNSDETKEIEKFYDFADFVPSIKKAEDRGFIRVKTMSNRFIVPVQVDRFQIVPVK